jgi:hypothetical protein
VLVSILVDRGFIGGVMVRRARLESGRSHKIVLHLSMFMSISSFFNTVSVS